MTILADQIRAVRTMRTIEVTGRVVAVRGLSLLVEELPAPIGTVVRIGGRLDADEHSTTRGEIVGFDGPRSVVMLLGERNGIMPGAHVTAESDSGAFPVGPALLGRVLNGLGRPIDGRGRLTPSASRSLWPQPLAALQRSRIREPLPTGVRAIDAMLTIGRGQRVGIFSGPGIGKSTLLAMIARNSAADVIVIGLIGERGREVRQFIEEALGEAGLKRSVLIVATGDESPLLRVRAAMAASTVAESFRDQGSHVLLLMDSLTRLAHAQRQIGLAVGEPPATKGYTPSVFAQLPMLIERAGAIEGGGSITGIYSVLVEGDDLTEPISDATRGILDGHISLSRRLASQNHFPAIDLLDSISRVADDVCDQHHITARRQILRHLAAYAEMEELINIGAYSRGTNADCDVAIAMKRQIDGFLTQDVLERAEYPKTCRSLIELSAGAQAHLAKTPTQDGQRTSAAGGKR